MGKDDVYNSPMIILNRRGCTSAILHHAAGLGCVESESVATHNHDGAQAIGLVGAIIRQAVVVRENPHCIDRSKEEKSGGEFGKHRKVWMSKHLKKRRLKQIMLRD
jgi:hypothetical protein